MAMVRTQRLMISLDTYTLVLGGVGGSLVGRDDARQIPSCMAK